MPTVTTKPAAKERPVFVLELQSELHFQRDFFSETAMPEGCEAIVTNPPFRSGGQFVAHALDLSAIVIVLLRLAFLESERRSHILDGGKLARLHVFKNRLPMMHRKRLG